MNRLALMLAFALAMFAAVAIFAPRPAGAQVISDAGALAPFAAPPAGWQPRRTPEFVPRETYVPRTRLAQLVADLRTECFADQTGVWRIGDTVVACGTEGVQVAAARDLADIEASLENRPVAVPSATDPRLVRAEVLIAQIRRARETERSQIEASHSAVVASEQVQMQASIENKIARASARGRRSAHHAGHGHRRHGHRHHATR